MPTTTSAGDLRAGMSNAGIALSQSTPYTADELTPAERAGLEAFSECAVGRRGAFRVKSSAPCLYEDFRGWQQCFQYEVDDDLTRELLSARNNPPHRCKQGVVTPRPPGTITPKSTSNTGKKIAYAAGGAGALFLLWRVLR